MRKKEAKVEHRIRKGKKPQAIGQYCDGLGTSERWELPKACSRRGSFLGFLQSCVVCLKGNLGLAIFETGGTLWSVSMLWANTIVHKMKTLNFLIAYKIGPCVFCYAPVSCHHIMFFFLFRSKSSINTSCWYNVIDRPHDMALLQGHVCRPAVSYKSKLMS